MCRDCQRDDRRSHCCNCCLDLDYDEDDAFERALLMLAIMDEVEEDFWTLYEPELEMKQKVHNLLLTPPHTCKSHALMPQPNICVPVHA